MKLSDVVNRIERRVPLSWAEEWDNPGLCVGDPSSDISRAALALDVTEDTVGQAAALGCRLLVTHHPIIFKGLKSIVLDRPAPKAIALALQSGVALYAAHTNWDSSPEGVNFRLAEALGLDALEPLVTPARANGAWGLGAVGSFMMPVSMKDCLKLLKERWRLSWCAGFGDGRRMVMKVALGGGSCGEMWTDALAKGADVFITADMPYHHMQDALNMGLNIISAEHGEMERASLPALKAIIEQETKLPVELLREAQLPRVEC